MRSAGSRKRTSARICVWAALISGALVSAGCASSRTLEPTNLQPHKDEVRQYVENGGYQREIASVALAAQTWLEQRVRKGGKLLTLVLDIDETLLSNWPLIKRQDFGYVPEEWIRWVDAASAPAIEPVRQLFHAAERNRIDVILITGRRERDRPGTEQNLKLAGCTGYARLICRKDDDRRTCAAFKVEAREKLVAEGRTLIANVGDQQSDLAGGFAERTFKLPNPFYVTE